MTTICYDHKAGVIAYDSRQSGGGTIYSDNIEKCVSSNEVKFIFSGYPADNEKIIKSYFSDEMAIDKRVCVEALAIDDGKVFMLTREGEELVVTHISYSVAIGSGFAFALSALDHGKSAVDAVKYAATRCLYTGGKIKTIKIK
jgi:ATP-dependent protease HslVU (ClpYQ) peptidase subunit